LRKFRKDGMNTKQILRFIEVIEGTRYYLRRKEVPKRAMIYELKFSQKAELLKVLNLH
jgi:hypothetical protein